jgi:hypothetical protein
MKNLLEKFGIFEEKACLIEVYNPRYVPNRYILLLLINLMR